MMLHVRGWVIAGQVRYASKKAKEVQADATVTAFSLYVEKYNGKNLSIKEQQNKWRALSAKTRERFIKQASDSQKARKKTMQEARPKKEDVPEAYALFVSKIFPQQYTLMKKKYPKNAEGAILAAKEETNLLWNKMQ